MELAIVLISSLFGVGGIAAILKTRSDSKKTEAEAEITLTGGWQVLYETYRSEARAEINELRERLAVVERSDMDCKRRLAKLEKDRSPVAIENHVMELVRAEIQKREGATSG